MGRNNIDMYTNGELRFATSVIAKETKAIVFDVGANVGDWASEISLSNPHAQIHCFEPSPTTFQTLAKRTFASENIIRNQMAVGSVRGSLNLYIYGNTAETNSLHPRHDTPYERIEEVPVVTLSDYCAEHNIEQIDFLKIDAERHDFDVLRGAQSLLLAGSIKYIQLEYGNNYIDSRVFLKDIFEFVEALDYIIFQVFPKQLRPIKTYSDVYESFENSNFAILHVGVASHFS